MNLLIKRDVLDQEFTLGTFYVDGKQFGYTCEDAVRSEKVYGKTAIPSGEYKVVLSFSHRFQKVMPEILNVPGFAGIRIHGGNTAEDTLGCPLLGQKRTDKGVQNCATVNKRLIDILQACEDRGEAVWIGIK